MGPAFSLNESIRISMPLMEDASLQILCHGAANLNQAEGTIRLPERKFCVWAQVAGKGDMIVDHCLRSTAYNRAAVCFTGVQANGRFNSPGCIDQALTIRQGNVVAVTVERESARDDRAQGRCRVAAGAGLCSCGRVVDAADFLTVQEAVIVGVGGERQRAVRLLFKIGQAVGVEIAVTICHAIIKAYGRMRIQPGQIFVEVSQAVVIAIEGPIAARVAIVQTFPPIRHAIIVGIQAEVGASDALIQDNGSVHAGWRAGPACGPTRCGVRKILNQLAAIVEMIE